MMDRYTRVLLTVMAAALVWLVLKDTIGNSRVAEESIPTRPPVIADEDPCAKCGSLKLDVSWGHLMRGEYYRELMTVTCDTCGYWWVSSSLDEAASKSEETPWLQVFERHPWLRSVEADHRGRRTR